MQADHEQLVETVTKLRREIRAARWLAVAAFVAPMAVAAVAMGGAHGSDQIADVVRARRIEVVGSACLVEIGSWDDAERGAGAASVSADRGVGLRIRSVDGETLLRASAAIAPDGEPRCGEVVLEATERTAAAGRMPVPRAELGPGTLTLQDGDQLSAGTRAIFTGAYVFATASHPNWAWTIQPGANGTQIQVSNKTGETVCTLGADEYGNGQVGAWNRNGKGRTLTPGD